MKWFPWGRERDADDDSTDGEAPRDGPGDGPLVTCEFQDGTISVYADRVHIERAGPSRFEDKTIPREEIHDVTYSKGVVIGYLQIDQAGVENDDGGFLTTPVDENTLHFGRGARDCAKRAREELLFGGA